MPGHQRQDDDDTEPMDTSDFTWCWFYQGECGFWHKTEDDPVNPISSSELERLYLNNPHRNVDFIREGERFKIDFNENVKINRLTGQRRKLKRSVFPETPIRCKCADQSSSVPAHWENMEPTKPYMRVRLNWQTSEYKKVERYVRETGLLQEPLKAIYRIQNEDLWELFCRKKTQLKRLKGQSDIDVRWLFHGTGKENMHNICLYNFDCNISESRPTDRLGHVWGKGTYFALHAAYADKYSKVRQLEVTSTKIMFLARVIVGKYKQGAPNLVKPDGDQKENIHDSCVDNTLCPRIFVVFNSDQIYPEYILEYGKY